MQILKVKGLQKAINELNKMASDVEKEVMLELKKISDEILADAVSRVHVLSGDLKRSAYIEKSENGYKIGFSMFYAPYEEFGTGGFVVVPNGYEKFSMEFYISGNGTGRAHPYLFPAFLARRDNIVNELEKKINELLKSK